MITIEKGVPLPRRYLTRGRPAKYPFGTMDVGDSFFLDDFEEYESAKAALAYWARKLGRRFTCEKSPGGGGRIWRVE